MKDKTASMVLTEHIQYTHDQAHREVLMDAAGARVVLICLDDGQNVPPHFHNHTDDIFVAIEGEGVIETAETQLSLMPGTCQMVLAGTQHTVRPVSGSRVAFLVIQNKPYDFVDTETV